MTVAVAIFADAPLDSADSSCAVHLLSFDFEMLVINWPFFSFEALTVAHRFVGPPNVVLLGADVMLRVANLNGNPVAVITDSDTVRKRRKIQTKKTFNIRSTLFCLVCE